MSVQDPGNKDSRVEGHQPRGGRALGWWLFFGLVVLLVIIAINLATGLGSSGVMPTLNVESITSWIKSYGSGAIIASWLVMILCALTIMPAEIPAMANGMIFGPYIGGLVTWSGAMIGANIAYGIARLIGPKLIDRWISNQTSRKFHSSIENNGTVVLLIARCIPLIPFFAINYLAGISSIKLWTFNWVTAIGILPMTAAMVTMGDQALNMPWPQWLTLALVLVAGFLILKKIVRRYVDRSGGASTVPAPDTTDKIDPVQ